MNAMIKTTKMLKSFFHVNSLKNFNNSVKRLVMQQARHAEYQALGSRVCTGLCVGGFSRLVVAMNLSKRICKFLARINARSTLDEITQIFEFDGEVDVVDHHVFRHGQHNGGEIQNAHHAAFDRKST